MILVDTHVVVWLAGSESKLSPRARVAIADARQRGEGLAIADITLFELALLASKRRIHVADSLESFLNQVAARFVVQPITAQTAARAASLPADYPKDPADRIIAASALVEGSSLITADAEIRRSGAVPTIW